jgi:hypothetical protein
MPDQDRFATLQRPARIWAIAAVHGERDRLSAIHGRLERELRRGDRIVYLGNLIGRGPAVADTVQEALLFRRAVLARPGMIPGDIVYLRGAQEEMWQKLMQIHFAQNPADVIEWMIGQGIGETLRAYGGDPDAGLSAAREGTVALSRWTGALRDRVRARPGHDRYLAEVRRAAATDNEKVLLVHAGVDPRRPLSAQRDSFWWGAPGFTAMTEPFEGFRRVVRGYDPQHAGLVETAVALSLDAGCGFGGALLCACLTPDGDVIEAFEA